MKPKVSPGDLYQLGKHRILCGDSEDAQTARRIIGRRTVRMLFAGPPYFNQRAYCSWDDYASYLDSMKATLHACVRLLGPGSVVTWLIGRGSSEQKDHASYHSIMLEEHGLHFQDAIAWIKPGANYTIKRSCHIRMNGYYYPAFKWETLLVYRKPGRMPRMGSRERSYMSQHHTDVWEIPWVTHQMRRFGHPSVCPTEIPRRCIMAYAKRNSFVLDPFGGFGSTLIAAEETGRSALLIERKAEYCEIAIRRWEEQTGGRARLLSSRP